MPLRGAQPNALTCALNHPAEGRLAISLRREALTLIAAGAQLPNAQPIAQLIPSPRADHFVGPPYAVGSSFHAFGRSLPQKTQTKSSSRTMLCS